MFITVSSIDFIYGTCILRHKKNQYNQVHVCSLYVVNNGFLHYPPVVHLSWM